VYIAHSSLENQIYAIKFFPYRDHTTSPFYESESRYTWIKHKNIIHIEETEAKYILQGKEKVLCSYIMMELAPFGNFQYLIKEDRLPDDLVLMRSYFVQLVDALTYLHEKNVAHMDLKLANLLLGKDFVLKVADFDCAVSKGDSLDNYNGTINFRAPEVISKHCKNPMAADVYSLGIILFCIVNRLMPYDEEYKIDGKDLFGMIKSQNPGFWEYHTGPYMTEEFKELFSWMVRSNPEERATLDDIKESKWYGEKIYNGTTIYNNLKTVKSIQSLLKK
jgi:serine/threonine protein kinase